MCFWICLIDTNSASEFGDNHRRLDRKQEKWDFTVKCCMEGIKLLGNTYIYILYNILQYFTLVPKTWGIKQRSKIAMSKDGKPPTQQTFRTLSRPDVSCTTKSRHLVEEMAARWGLAGDNGSRLKTQGTTDWKWLECPFLLGGLEHVFFPYIGVLIIPADSYFSEGWLNHQPDFWY